MPTNLIRSLLNVTPKQQGGVLTIGNFDGVHLGHQALVSQVVALAQAKGLPSIVITFEPHPFEFFSGDKLTIPRITRLREKFKALLACKVDNVIILSFNQRLANLSASDFVALLVRTLQPKHFIIGDDFRFGFERQGDIHLLKKLSEAFGFTVEGIKTINEAGERISSTRLRQALAQGDLTLAKRLLGHPYTMLGRIRRGDQRGRQLGFPTANIYLHRKLTPIRGVYTVYVHGLGPKPLPGVANIGIRPTVDGTRSLLEVHLLNFNQEIYGRYVEIEFCKKLRDEVKYPDLDSLKAQIKQDVIAAQLFFNDKCNNNEKNGVL